jgi:hypothetical protein
MNAGIGVNEDTLGGESLGAVAGDRSLRVSLKNSEAARKSIASEFSSGSGCSSLKRPGHNATCSRSLRLEKSGPMDANGRGDVL